jgi:hypothetical protein
LLCCKGVRIGICEDRGRIFWGLDVGVSGHFISFSLLIAALKSMFPRKKLAPQNSMTKSRCARTTTNNVPLHPQPRHTRLPHSTGLDGQNLNANLFGLTNTSVLLHSFVSASLSLTMSFGLFLGSQSIMQPRDGHIVFEGYNAALVDGAFCKLLDKWHCSDG